MYSINVPRTHNIRRVLDSPRGHVIDSIGKGLTCIPELITIKYPELLI